MCEFKVVFEIECWMSSRTLIRLIEAIRAFPVCTHTCVGESAFLYLFVPTDEGLKWKAIVLIVVPASESRSEMEGPPRVRSCSVFLAAG